MPIGTAALGVIVHPDNEDDALTIDKLEQIVAGMIANCRVAGEDRTIRGYSLHARDPVMGIYRDLLASAKAARGLKLTPLADTQKVVLAVARDPSGLGFVDISQMPRDENSVKLLPIMLATDVVSIPAPGSVPENYPLMVQVTLHVSPNAGQTVNAFADFLAGGDFANVLTEHGLLSPSSTKNVGALPNRSSGFGNERRAN